MSEEVGLMSLLINALTVGKKDEFTLAELKDTVMAYARGEVPEVVTLLSKEDMDKFNKASVLEKVLHCVLKLKLSTKLKKEKGCSIQSVHSF